MGKVLTPAKYKKICKNISEIDDRNELQGYLDSLDAKYSSKNELFWLLLYTQLSKFDDYDCKDDVHQFWEECLEDVPHLDYYKSAPNPAIRYAKVHACYREQESDIKSVVKSKKKKAKKQLKITAETIVPSRTFSSPHSISALKEMFRFLEGKGYITNTSEQTFLQMFTKVAVKELTQKIHWTPNKGGKYFNDTLFMLLHKLCPNQYDQTTGKKNYYLLILECFDLSLNNTKKNPKHTSLESRRSEWVKRVSMDETGLPNNLDRISMDIYDFQASDSSK